MTTSGILLCLLFFTILNTIGIFQRIQQINTMKKVLYTGIAVAVLVFITACANEAPTVVPGAITGTFTGTEPGDNIPRLIGIYPDTGDIDIPVDADIILVFSRAIDPATIDAASLIIRDTVTSEVMAINSITPVSGGNTVIVNITGPVAGNLQYSHLHTLQLTTAIQDFSVPPLNLDAVYNTTFTTAADSLPPALPRVVAATRFPANGATGVSADLAYVEVTFTRDMSLASIDTASFTLFPAAGAGVTPVNSKTYRLDLNPLAYNQVYTVDLTNAITDTVSNPLFEDGNDTWSFTTEPDPDTVGPLAINSVWVDSVTPTSAWIYFTTNKPSDRTTCFVDYDVNSGAPYAWTSLAETDWDGDGKDLHTLHKIQITGLLRSTVYYYRVRAGALTSGESTLITDADTTAGVNFPLTSAANGQDAIRTVQVSDGSAFVFWESHGGNDDIYGQFFNTAGATQWGANGAAVSNHANNQSGIEAVSNGFNDVVLVYRDATVGNDLYAKMVFNNAPAVGFRWGGAAAAQGVALGITVKAGSTYSAALAHEWPVPISSGTADMPANGVATNLLYDKDTDFSALGLAANDWLLWGGGPWNQAAIFDVDSFNVFRFVIRSDGATSLAATSYYLADQTAVATGTVVSVTSPNVFRAIDIDLPLVNVSDVINCNGTWAIVSNITSPLVGVYEITTDVAHGLAAGNPFSVYPRIAGPLASEAVANPLWDQLPAALFNPGATVLANDVVVNENNNTGAATWARVNAINLAEDTDYALQLSSDIMHNGDSYSVLRLPMTPAGTEDVGFSPAVAPADFTLTDFTGLNYGGAGVATGDIVYNIDADLSAMVTTVAGATLTLSADIFNGTLEKYIIFQRRGFLVAFIDAGDFVMARAFNLADGSPLGAVFAVTTSGISSNPVALSDGAGDVMIFYQNAGAIRWKKVSADGAFVWSDPLADQVSDAGITDATLTGSGYSIVQVLPTRSTGAVGGAYLLAKNGSGSIRVLRINGATGAVAWNNAVSATGYEPHMAVDTVAGTANRVIVTYRDNAGHIPADYYHIRAVAYNAAGLTAAPGFAAINVSSTAASYDCRLPQVIVADAAAGASEFYIAWFDGRYFGTAGFALFGQRFTSAGAVVWAPEVFISTPTSYVYDTLDLKLLYWDDGAAPFGLTPLWLDYRDGATAPDIYYEHVADTGSY